MKIVLIKAYYLISIIKRYYKLIKHAYKIIITKIKDINPKIALQIAFKAINNIASTNGLILTLLVYNAYLCISENNAPFATIPQRASAIRKAIAEIQCL